MANELFNPEVNIKDPRDFTASSKGIEVDTRGGGGVGTLLSQVGDFLSLATKTAEIAIKGDIDASLREDVDQIQNERGVADAANINQSGAKDVPPPDIDRSMKFLERNAQAVRQGTMQMSSYWARLESTSRELRARHPGYRDYIDEKMSSLTGSKPANAIVRTLHSEALAAKEKRDSTAEREQSFILSNFHYLPQEMQEGWRRGNTNNDQAIIAIGRMKGIEQTAQTESAVLNSRVKKGEVVENDAYKSLETNFSKLNEEYKKSLPSALGMSTDQVDKYISDVASGKRIPTPEEKQSLNAFILGARKNAENMLRRHANEFFKNIPGVAPNASRIETAIQANLKEFDAYNQALTGDGKGISIITMDKDRAQAELESEKVAALRSPLIKRGAVIREFVGDAAYAGLLNGPLKSSVERVIHTYMTGGILDKSNRSVNDAIVKAREAFGQVVNPAEVETVKTLTAVMTNPKTPVEKKVELVNAFFGDENKGLIRTVKPQDRETVYASMTTPEVFKAVKELSSEDPGVMDRYKSYVMETANVHGIKALNTLSSFEARNDNQYFKVVYDDRGFFRSVRNPSVTPDQFQASQMANYKRAVDNIVGALNTYAKPMRDIAVDEKRDPKETIGTWLSTVGMQKLIPLLNVTTTGVLPATSEVFDLSADGKLVGLRTSELEAAGRMLLNSNLTITDRESTNVEDRRGMLSAGQALREIPLANPKTEKASPEVEASFQELRRILDSEKISALIKEAEADRLRPTIKDEDMQKKYGPLYDLIFRK